MRLVAFEHAGQTRFGVWSDAGIVDCTDIAPSPQAYLHQHGDDLAPLRARTGSAKVRAEDVRFLPPIAAPQKLLCIGLNYRDHAEELGLALPTQPTVFAKFANGLVGNGATIELPLESEQLDYEAELVIVIGKRGRRIAEKDAYAHVAGYTIMNDVSVRDYQMRTTQWIMGKAFDTHAPCGPALVTRDEIADPQALDIALSVNGETLQQSNTRQLVFTVPQLVADLSKAMTLEPGDMIATGTPGGVGMSRKPPRWLRDGDRVRVEIAGLGALENIVRAVTA